MPTNPKAKNHSFNVILSPDDYEHLEAIADSTRSSMGSIIRSLIQRHWDMAHRNVPMCVDGQRCLVPHLHVAPLTPQGPQPAA